VHQIKCKERSEEVVQYLVLVLTASNTVMGAYAIRQREHALRAARKRHKKLKKGKKNA
jgi:hypothetical protein